MENLGSEIGQKMRHAVKAKLLELGTGTSSGYVDDELPDYVMIMVANKRSRQQMVDDLNLFLGSNTEEFVSWLHQVLQKLQEVSIPATVPPKASKRKQSDTSDVSSHKKEKRKEKKTKKPSKSQSSVSSSSKSTVEKSKAPPSITDVFANQLIQKAKKTLATEATVNVKKREKTPPEVSQSEKRTPENDFDIPTITQISTNTVEQTRRKELLELEEIQKKIYQAKRQLRNLTSDESEDEDFINLKADGEEFDEPDMRQTESIVDSTRNQSTFRNPSPIVFDLPNRRVSHSSEGTPEKELTPKRGSVKERLGSKPPAEPTTTAAGKNVISLSANRRSEKEIYIPAFRRREMEKAKELALSKDSTKPRRTRDESPERANREKRNGKEQKVELKPVAKPSVRQRIGSRVIVAPPKPEFDEDAVDVSISSIVTIKPRPAVPKSKQANKNLLLRAMAEAQKSTATAMRRSSENDKITRKGTRGKANILIEVPRGDETEASREDEYVPTPIVSSREEEEGVVYIPQVSREEIEINSSDDDTPAEANEGDKKRPQFVVTLDGIFKGLKESPRKNQKLPLKAPKERLVDKKILPVEPRNRDARKSSPIRKNDSPVRSKRDEGSGSKRSIEKESSKESEQSEPPRKKKTRCSPIRFDLDDKPKKVESPGTPKKSHKTPEKEVEKNSKSDGDGHTVTIRKIEIRKYENLPSLLSSVAVPQSSTKPKDRCKYFPNCSKGDTCEFIHPSMPCKSFPNCKFGDMCLYLHPKCKYDLTCSRLDCNFSHTPIVTAAPPLASHVVPVNNYKMITQNLLPPLCKFYPKCSNTLCTFYHPKLCRFGKACMNKVECNFYHYDIPAVDKFRWVSTASGSGSGHAPASTYV
ncbi:zinc finger CCCH domain-containing protein 14 [Lutzomyia longipalpis]|uniref:zinc finger CCCH domain-containing protein 14 n=1 Tax=Lutzomyia longipalpis TaxID=7200 RepID=UPI0024833D7E|nr:zinc finger CCCH domain-containing protein 14 [Lutzomyia longipalpis]